MALLGALTVAMFMGMLLGFFTGYRIGQLDERDKRRDALPALRRLFLALQVQNTELLQANRNEEALDNASREVLHAMDQAAEVLK